MKATIKETHVRKITSFINRHELSALLAVRVVELDGIDLGGPGVTFKVDFRDATEGSPSYKVGTEAVVTIEVKLPGDGDAQ